MAAAAVTLTAAGPMLPARSLRIRTAAGVGLSYRRLLRAFAKQIAVDADKLRIYRAKNANTELPEDHLDEVATEAELVVRYRLPCFVIVLERDERRVAHVRHRVLPRLPSPVVRPAVDGADASALHAALRRHRICLDPDYARTCTVGQLGCACSHLDAWKIAANSPASVVLEDDVVLQDDFEARLEEVLTDAADLDWDWIYLFYHPECKHHLPIPGKKSIQAGFETWGTVAYVVSQAGAAKLLKAACDAVHEAPIDHVIMRLVRTSVLRTLCATDLLVTTAGQLNPLRPAGDLGSNVWGTPTLLATRAS